MPQFCQNPVMGVHEILSLKTQIKTFHLTGSNTQTHTHKHTHTHLNNVTCNDVV